MGALLAPVVGTGSKDVTAARKTWQLLVVAGIAGRISLRFASQLGRRWRTDERMATGGKSDHGHSGRACEKPSARCNRRL